MARLIIPGWHGSGPGHWQRLWLEGDKTSRLVEQDNWAEPDLAAWLPRLHEQIGRETSPVTLVAYSLGVVLVAHYAARYPKAPIAAALLVAPGGVDHAAIGPELASFAPVPRTSLPFPAVLVVSRNDALMTYDRAVQLGNDWGARIVDEGNAGHINVDAGYGPWSVAFKLAVEAEAAAKRASVG
jgi:uncharacterized protein